MEELDQKQPTQAVVGHYRNKVVDGASSDTAFFENHRSTICF